MNKNTIIGIAAVVVIAVGAGSFYAGMKYGQSQRASRAGTFTRQFNGNSGPNGAAGADGQRVRINGGGFTIGEILSKDDKSITVKLADGGSKIVFYSDSTVVSKSATTTMQDLTVGENVMVSGTTNQDGSISAQMVQIRPAGAPMPEQGQPRPQ